MIVLAGTGWAQQYVISTVAGGAPPPTPAPGVNVSVGNPVGDATDAAGNLYFSSLNCIFKLDLHGVVTRVAGTSRVGYSGDGGAATLAELSFPNGLAVDGTGNIFFADTGNSRVRRISNGIITTVAGTGFAGYSGDGNPAANATLYDPTAVAVDGQGNLFIADSNNNVIRKVATNGIISTLAGTGTAGYSGDGGSATSAQLSRPQYVAVDGQGNVYFSDTGNNRVRKISANGMISTLAGTGVAGFSGEGGPAANAELQNAQGVAVDGSNDVFIMDANRVRKVSAAGIITTVGGTGVNGSSGDGGPALNAQINGSYGLAVDTAGNLFIADYYSLSIREISANGIINTVAGTGLLFSGDNGAAPSAQFGSITGIAVDGSGNLFIADNSRLRKVTPNGIVTTVAGTGVCCGPGASGVAATSTDVSPERVAVDGSGNIFFSDFFSVVHKVSTSGIITTVAGNGNAGFSGDGGPAISAQLANPPGGVAVDASGNLYIADANNNRVRKVSTSGIITTVAGNGASGFAGDGGQATSAQLSQPQGVAVDSSGNLYIADSNNNRVRKVSVSTGVITTLAGNGAGGQSGDGGQATNAQLQYPEGVAVDGQGDVFIADSANYHIREVTPGGVISTVAGSNYGYSGDCGLAASAQLASPADVAVDGSGHVFIADSGNNAVRRLQPTSQPTLLCAVTDAASQSQGPVSPGKIVTLYGTGMGPSAIDVAAPVNGLFGTQLAGTSVLVNGVPAPLIYTLAGQVSAIVPYEVTGSVAQVTVSYQGASSSFAVPIAASAPSIFTASGAGSGQAAAVNNADNSLNGVASPVKIGSYVQLYVTGEGLLSPAGLDGALAPTVLPLPLPVLQVTATVGGLPATVYYAGATPGEVFGLMQVDVLVPAGVQPGSQVPVVLQVGAVPSGAGVWIAVAAN